LERSHDLAEHIGRYGRPGYSDELTPKIRGILAEMGDTGVRMWRAVADAFLDRDAGAAAVLIRQDDDLDRLHAELTRGLQSGALDVALTVEMALVGRFFERLGDHALMVSGIDMEREPRS
jgi:phosphate transport system protein